MIELKQRLSYTICISAHMTDGISGCQDNWTLICLPPIPLCSGGNGSVGGRYLGTGHHVLCTTQIGPLGQEDLRPIRWGHTY